MAHKTFDILREEITAAAKLVTVGGIYAHYKDENSRYKVTGLAISEASDEVVVRYVSESNPDIEFVRPLSSWIATVEQDSKTAPRFKEV